MSKIRRQRTADQIMRVLSELMRTQLSDPRLQGITITEVAIDRELEHADVYIHALGDDSRQKEVVHALDRASGFLRRELAAQIRIKSVPQLHFHWDPTLKQADKINEILDNLQIPPAAEEE